MPRSGEAMNGRFLKQSPGGEEDGKASTANQIR